MSMSRNTDFSLLSSARNSSDHAPNNGYTQRPVNERPFFTACARRAGFAQDRRIPDHFPNNGFR